MIKTKDIIKILPFDESYRHELLDSFDSMDPDEKYDLERLLWKGYRAFYNILLDSNMQLAINNAADGKESLDPEFYKRIQEKTKKEIEELGTKATETVDLTEARKAMELIVKEIHASKKK